MQPEDKEGKTCKRCGAVVSLRTYDAGSLAEPSERTTSYTVCECDSNDGPDID